MERLTPSSALFERRCRLAGRATARGGRLRALGLLDPLPLPVDVRGGADLRVTEDMRVAPNDLGGDRRVDVGEVEDAGLGGELGMQHDLQPEVAQLSGELGSGSLGKRVVHLVGLLEEVVAQRFVGLLPVPRAAVRRPKPVGDPGQRPGRGGGQLLWNRAQIEGRLEVSGGQLADGGLACHAEPADRVVERVETAHDGERVMAGRPVTARQRDCGLGRNSVRAAPPGGRRRVAAQGPAGPRRAVRRARSRRPPRGRGPSAVAPRRAGRRARDLRQAEISRSMVVWVGSFLIPEYQFVKALALRIVTCAGSGDRVATSFTL